MIRVNLLRKVITDREKKVSMASKLQEDVEQLETLHWLSRSSSFDPADFELVTKLRTRRLRLVTFIHYMQHFNLSKGLHNGRKMG